MHPANLRLQWSVGFVLICLAVFRGPAAALAAPPRLLFTDLESGPAAGGEGDLGPFITIYGKEFGAAQGSSTVTLGGQPMARLVSWEQNTAFRGLDRIVAQPGPGAVSGNLVVTVNGVASNGLPFAVRPGGIYFVNPATGNDNNPGTHAQPWATIWRPRTTLLAGDIVYVEGGTFSQLDPERPGWDTLLFLSAGLGVTGTPSAPIAYLGYPGRPPLFTNVNARRGIYFNQDDGPLSHYVIGNMRFGEQEDAILVTGIGHRIVGNDLSHGGVGHKVGVFGDTSAIRILGNRFVENGTTETKYYSIYVQGFGVNRDIDIGWNEIRGQEGRAIQVYGHADGDLVDDLRIHDNVLADSDLNNIVLGGSDGANEILGTVYVTGNIITGSRNAEGLRVNDPRGMVIVENNTLVGNTVAQIYLEEAGAGRITLRNNVIIAAAGQQYYEFDEGASSASIVPSNNLVYGAGSCEGWEIRCVSRDPLFVGATDFHLRSGSPAIDAGVPTSASLDFDGVSRPQGSAFDIGAYEFRTGTACVSPSIVSQPVSQTVATGAAVTLRVTANGTPPLSFQWYEGASGTTTSPVSGATANTFVSGPITVTTSYWVRVGSECGTVDSATATITTGAAPHRRRPVRRGGA